MIFNWFKNWFKRRKKDTKNIPIEKQPSESDDKQSDSQVITPPSDSKDESQLILTNKLKLRAGKLGAALLKYDMISHEDLQKALNIQKESAGTKRKLLGEILVEHKFITEEQLISAFARHCRIPYVKINKYGLSREAIKAVPEELVLKHKILPTDKIGSVLIIAVLDPYNTVAIQEIEAKTGLKVKTLLCKQSEFREMVGFYYPNLKDEFTDAPIIITTEDKKETLPQEKTPELSKPSEGKIEKEEPIAKIELPKEIPSGLIEEPLSAESPLLEEATELIQSKNISQQPDQILAPYAAQVKIEQTPLEALQESPVTTNKQTIEKEKIPSVPSVIEDKNIITNIKEKKPDKEKEMVAGVSEPLPQPPKDLTPDQKHSEPCAKKAEPKLSPAVTVKTKQVENFVIITEEEFIMAKRLLSAQRLHLWEQQYHRGRPLRAEKIDENEFAFYTENLIDK